MEIWQIGLILIAVVVGLWLLKMQGINTPLDTYLKKSTTTTKYKGSLDKPAYYVGENTGIISHTEKISPSIAAIYIEGIDKPEQVNPDHLITTNKFSSIAHGEMDIIVNIDTLKSTVIEEVKRRADTAYELYKSVMLENEELKRELNEVRKGAKEKIIADAKTFSIVKQAIGSSPYYPQSFNRFNYRQTPQQPMMNEGATE